ncbi:glycosyltransferase family 4 protein, partial [Aureispira]|nr:glycosyltransferase family 4 protein [Aureispira sp.]
MKILQLTKKFPYPLKDGEAIAITSLAKALHELNCEVSLLSMNTTKHFFDINALPDTFDHYKNMDLVTVDNRLKVFDAFLNLFSSQSYHISRFLSKNYKTKLIELLKKNKYDIVQLETLYLAPYVDVIRKYSNAKIVMRSHNVEHEIWKRITKNTSISAKKMYLRLLSKRLEDFELLYLNKYDMMVAITERDLNFFKKLGCTIPSNVSPIGLQLSGYTRNVKTQKHPTFCFIGSLDWMPNIEGIDWILDNVWHKVIEKVPNAHFHIAGKNTPDRIKNTTCENVIVHGEVPDAVDFINAHDIMLVPLFSGSGMRVKILEGMALGRVVLSTTLGIEGIIGEHNKNVLIANDPEHFAQEMIRCFNNPELIANLGSAAIELVNNHYDNISIATTLVNSYNELL